MGSAGSAKMNANGNLLVKIANNTQKTIFMDPGTYSFQMTGMAGSKKEVYDLKMEAGKTYYIKIIPIQKLTLLFYHQIIDESQAKVEIQDIPN